MKSRMILAASTLGALLSSPALAEVELLPLGTADGSIGTLSASADTKLAYGISGAFEYAVAPFLSIGVAPRLILNVITEDATDGDSSDKALDLRARIRGHYAVSPGLELYASLSPGYTIVMSSEEGAESATGFAIAGALGATYDVSPKMFVGAEVGYSRAFTSADIMLGGPPITADLDLSYMHVGIGAGTRF
jgi:opacity protein-like surface antigen